MADPQSAVVDPAAPDHPEFYEVHWRRARTSADPHVLAKAELLAGLVPADVTSLLDVGCGDGTITAVMAQRWRVTAVDRSAEALAHVGAHSPQVERVQASADQLPFADRGFDMTMTSEMLEHLPSATLTAAAAEIGRVTRRWLLVSVPHRENVRKRFVQCPQCQLEFNLYGHLHAIDADRIAQLFPGFVMVRTVESGPVEAPTSPTIEQFRQRYGRRWHLWRGVKAHCPACGNQEFPLPVWRPQHRLADKASDLATSLWRAWTDATPHPYWITVLMERRADA